MDTNVLVVIYWQYDNKIGYILIYLSWFGGLNYTAPGAYTGKQQ